MIQEEKQTQPIQTVRKVQNKRKGQQKLSKKAVKCIAYTTELFILQIVLFINRYASQTKHHRISPHFWLYAIQHEEFKFLRNCQFLYTNNISIPQPSTTNAKDVKTKTFTANTGTIFTLFDSARDIEIENQTKSFNNNNTKSTFVLDSTNPFSLHDMFFTQSATNTKKKI